MQLAWRDAKEGAKAPRLLWGADSEDLDKTRDVGGERRRHQIAS